jgi:predicted lipid-binding transport protein (Tim44 family)
VALALTSRRSTVAAVASALAAMALAAAVAGRSCRVSQPGPEIVVRDLVQAAKTGDRDTIFELLTPATRARLEAEAKRATDLVGAAQRYTAKDLISIGSSDGVDAPTDITVIEERGDRAVVQIVSPSGRSDMTVVKIDGRWHIDLPQYGAP